MFDLIIIGYGPAGIAAGIYSQIYQIRTLLIGKKPGGYATEAYKIINYPGFAETTGSDLMDKFKKHLDKFNVLIKTEMVLKITKNTLGYKVVTNKNKYQSKVIILASGSQRRRLNIPGESEFIGKGVVFCATCDAYFYKNKVVAVIGGSDTSLTAAIQLSEIAKKIYIVFRKNTPTAMPTWVQKVKNNPKIVMIPKTNIIRINGKKFVENIELDNPFQGKKQLDVNGVFIEIGSAPLTGLIKPLGVKFDDGGYVIVNIAQETNIKGLFAAGDCTTNSNKFEQIVTASAEGAIAANSVLKYLKNK